MSFNKTALEYLQACKVEVSKTFFNNRLQSHPDYPALVSLTDTLDELKLSYSALMVDKEKYEKLDYPVLAHVKQLRYDDFVIVRSANEFEQNDGNLFDNWNGITLSIKTNQTISSAKHNELLLKEKKEIFYIQATIFFFVAPLIVFALINFSISGLILILLSLIGVGICSLIVMRSLGKDNFFTEQLCSSEGSKGCDKVLKSNLAELGRDINLGDVGLVYFTGTCIFFGIELSGNKNMYSLFASVSAIGFCLSIVSIYYQWRIIKSWCKMCLMIAGIVWLQTIIAFERVFFNGFQFALGEIFILTLSLVAPLFIWLFLKSLIIKVDALRTNEIYLLKLKRDIKVFSTLLNKQDRIDVSPWEDDLVFGNPKGRVKILAVCNPYCAPCSKAHSILENTLELFRDHICLTIRFALNKDDLKERKVAAVVNIIKAYNEFGEITSDCIKNWYAYMDLQQYKLLYKSETDINLYKPIISKYVKWTEKNNLGVTPRIYLEGYQWPNAYQLEELNLVINQIIENIEPLGKPTSLIAS